MNKQNIHLAQFNYARARHAPEDPRMAGFTGALDAINGLADASPGFRWRLKTERGHSIDLRPFPDDELKLITLSTWDHLNALRAFVYRSHHAHFLRRRDEWFEKESERYLVMWWRTAIEPPTIDEGMSRLAYLRQYGPSPHAFDFSETFPFDQNLAKASFAEWSAS